VTAEQAHVAVSIGGGASRVVPATWGRAHGLYALISPRVNRGEILCLDFRRSTA
jgi:hypothetical protein